MDVVHTAHSPRSFTDAVTISSFVFHHYLNLGDSGAAVGCEAVGADCGAIQAVGELGILGSACVYSSRSCYFSLFCGDHWPSHITCIDLPYRGRHCCSVPLRFLVFWIYSPCAEVAWHHRQSDQGIRILLGKYKLCSKLYYSFSEVVISQRLMQVALILIFEGTSSGSSGEESEKWNYHQLAWNGSNVVRLASYSGSLGC